MALERLTGTWQTPGAVAPRAYTCGYCNRDVSSERGWETERYGTLQYGHIRICPQCNHPTFLKHGRPSQVPGPRAKGPVLHLPNDVESLYEEALQAHAACAYTAAVLALRKLLMHVAVEKGAKPDRPFVAYVEYLDAEKYLGRDGKPWVDHIRLKSNEANHEICLMTAEDSDRLLTLAEMLLKLVYEFPGSLPAPSAG